MSESEAAVLREIDADVNGTTFARIFPNVVGRFRCVPKSGAPYMVQCGLKKGSGDRIGFQSVLITPDMVGRYIAQFVSIEGKKNAKAEIGEGQAEWRDIVIAYGGAAMITYTPKEVPLLLKRFSKGIAKAPDPRELRPKFLVLEGGLSAKKERTKKNAV